MASESEMRLAVAVTVHVVLEGRSASGFSVKAVAGDALIAKVCSVPQFTANALGLAETDSLKLRTILEPTAMPVALSAGLVMPKAGAASTGAAAVVKEKV